MDLTTRINQAQKVLSASYGIDKKVQQEGFDVYRYLTEDGLARAYTVDTSRKEISNQFLNISQSIRNMRSSYFPADFFLTNATEEDGSQLIQDIQSNVGSKESYENTFLRMLGMPCISFDQNAVSGDVHRVSPDTVLKILNPITGALEEQNIRLVDTNIFYQRNQPPGSRTFIIDNSFYDITADSTATIIIPDKINIESFSLEEKANLLSFRYADGKVYNDVVSQGTTTSQDITRQVQDLKELSRVSGTDNPFVNPISKQFVDPSRLAAAPIPGTDPATRTANIQEMSKDMYKFCYLLFPPVQDPKVSITVNEPEKLVAPPFANSFMKKVNSNTVKGSLLESIIRIRLDKITGTNSLYSDPENPGALKEITVGDATVTTDDYGILEALFIVRLKCAIMALSTKMVYDIDALINEIDKAKRYPAPESQDPGAAERRPLATSNLYTVSLSRNEAGITGADVVEEEQAPTTPTDDQSVTTDLADQNQESAGDADQNSEAETQAERQEDEISESTLVNLQNQKLVEDSLLFFLSQNEKEVLDLQFQTQRTSGIYSSHMMSGLINIVDVPRKRIDEELAKITRQRDERARTVIDELTGEVGITLGTDIGIGTLDIAVFCLALFTISEDSLLGLLTQTQFERMKNGDFKSLIPRSRRKKDVVPSVNELTDLIYQGYQLFKFGLSNTDARNTNESSATTTEEEPE
jgi:hypothetical protein